MVWRELTERRDTIGEEQFQAGARAVSKLGAGLEALGQSVTVPVTQLDRLNARLALLDSAPVRDLALEAEGLARRWDAIADAGDVVPTAELKAAARAVGRLTAELEGLGQDVEVGFDLDTSLGTAAARAELEELAKAAGLSLRDVELDAEHLEAAWNAIELSPFLTQEEVDEQARAVAVLKVALERLGEPVAIHLTGAGQLAELNELARRAGTEGFRDLQQEAHDLEAAWIAAKAAFADGLITPRQFLASERGLDALRQEIERLGQSVDVGDLPAVNIPVNLQFEDAVAAWVQDGAPAIQAELARIGADGIEPLGESLSRVFRGEGVEAALSFGDALVDAAIEGEVAWDRFFKSLLSDLAKAIVKALILRAITTSIGAGGGGGSEGGGLFPESIPVVGGLFAEGGKVTGGTPGKDSVPALLTPGEYVVAAPAVKRVGQQFLEAINTGRMPVERGGARRAEQHDAPSRRLATALLTPDVPGPVAARLARAIKQISPDRETTIRMAGGGLVSAEMLAPRPAMPMAELAKFAEGGLVGLPPMLRVVPNLNVAVRAQGVEQRAGPVINIDASIRDVTGLTESQTRQMLLKHSKDVADAVRDALRLGL